MAPHHPLTQDDRNSSGRPVTNATPFRLGRLGPLFLIGQLGWAIPGAASATLLQAVVSDVDPARKLALYTVLTIAGAVTSAIGTIVGGVLSDRTRSRFGRRSPWLIASSLTATVALIGTGILPTAPLIIAAYAVFQLSTGTFVSVLGALIPDHVPAHVVGRASAYAGVGFLLGQTIAGVVAGAFITHPYQGLIAVPWTIVAAAVLLAIFIHDTAHPALTPPEKASFLRDLIPPASTDFWLAFAGRFLFLLGIVTVSLFQLFTLTDYLHLTTAKAGEVISISTAIFGILGFASVIVAGPLSDRIGRRKPFVVGAPLLAAAGLAPVILAPSLSTYLIFFAVSGVAFGSYVAVDQALMVAVLPNPDRAARDLGFLTIGQTLPGVVAPLLGGILATTLGYGAIFVASLVIVLLAGISILGIRSVK